MPALTVAAMVKGAVLFQATDPPRARRYAAVAARAMGRLRARHIAPDVGLLVVGGRRNSYAGIDPYAHTVAYNALALFGLTVAGDAATELDLTPAPRIPADQRLQVSDSDTSGLAVVGNRSTWLAVHRHTSHRADLRYRAGLMALKQRSDGRWRDLIAPLPRTSRVADRRPIAPALRIAGRPMPFEGVKISTRPGTITVRGGFRNGDALLRRGTRQRFTATRHGVRLSIGNVRAGDRFSMVLFSRRPVVASGRTVTVDGTTWRFPTAVRSRPVPRPYHSAPVESLRATTIVFTLRRRGTMAVAIERRP